MLIGEISKKTGLTRDTIRFYEKKGLIKVERTDSEWNNYKNYSEHTLKSLLLIKKVKSFGFTLNEISDLLEMYNLDMASCDLVKTKVNEKLREIDQKISTLNSMKNIILDRFNEAKNNCHSTTGKNNCPTFFTT